MCGPCLQYIVLYKYYCKTFVVDFLGVFPTGIGGVEQLLEDRPEQERVGLPWEQGLMGSETMPS